MADATLKKWLFYMYFLSAGASLLVVEGVLIGWEVYARKTLAAEELNAYSSVVEKSVAGALGRGDRKAATEALGLLAGAKHISAAAIYGPDGRVFAAMEREKGAAPLLSETGGFDLSGISINRPINHEGAPLGSLYIRLDFGKSYFVKYASVVIAGYIGGFLGAFLILRRLEKRITAPVSELSGLLLRVSDSKDYTLPTPRQSIAEFSAIAEGLERLLAEIRKTKEALELRVRERTARLERTLEERDTYERALEGAYEKLKESEKTLVQTVKMASLGEMGAGIAHELNSPIAGILSIAEAMIRRTEGKDRFLLEKIKDAAVRCKYIILDMLAYARPETAELKPLYLNEIIKSTLSLFISELKKASIEIREEFAPDVPEIVGNKGQLMQAFLNIIKNARDAIQGPGTIAIKTGVSEKGRYAFAEISDTGAGISEEIKDRIFDPFFTTKKDVRTNVGLGLSITRSIMESHGGRIEFSNRTGGGAVFRVYLPLEGGADAGGGNREDKGAEV